MDSAAVVVALVVAVVAGWADLLPVMVPPQDILTYLRAVPFRPFWIHMASGRTFDIRHPEMIAVSRSSITIYTFLNDDETEAKEHQVEVSLLLTESVEPLDAATRPQGA